MDTEKLHRKLQQGDVILKRINSIPSGATKKERRNGVHTVAYGEATGHAHIIQDTSVELYEKDGVLYITSEKPASIQHLKPSGVQAEHNPIPIQAGIWQIGIVREFDAFSEEVRRIRD